MPSLVRSIGTHPGVVELPGATQTCMTTDPSAVGVWFVFREPLLVRPRLSSYRLLVTVLYIYILSPSRMMPRQSAFGRLARSNLVPGRLGFHLIMLALHSCSGWLSPATASGREVFGIHSSQLGAPSGDCLVSGFSCTSKHVAELPRETTKGNIKTLKNTQPVILYGICSGICLF